MKAGTKIAIGIVAAAFLVVLLRSFVATSCLIPSGGMEPALHRGERILVNKWSYGLRVPLMVLWGYRRLAERPVHRGDVVVFNNPANLSRSNIELRETFIGRCTGLPGDTLYIDSLFNTYSCTPTTTDLLLHPLIIPQRGATLRVREWNITLLRNTLVMHEHRRADIKGDTLLVDGKPVNFCRFSQNYYWVETDNATSRNDSRLFGLVPESHLIGRAGVVWFSKEEDKGLLKGYRWNRFFCPVK